MARELVVFFIFLHLSAMACTWTPTYSNGFRYGGRDVPYYRSYTPEQGDHRQWLMSSEFQLQPSTNFQWQRLHNHQQAYEDYSRQPLTDVDYWHEPNRLPPTLVFSPKTHLPPPSSEGRYQVMRTPQGRTDLKTEQTYATAFYYPSRHMHRPWIKGPMFARPTEGPSSESSNAYLLSYGSNKDDLTNSRLDSEPVSGRFLEGPLGKQTKLSLPLFTSQPKTDRWLTDAPSSTFNERRFYVSHSVSKTSTLSPYIIQRGGKSTLNFLKYPNANSARFGSPPVTIQSFSNAIRPSYPNWTDVQSAVSQPANMLSIPNQSTYDNTTRNSKYQAGSNLQAVDNQRRNSWPCLTTSTIRADVGRLLASRVFATTAGDLNSDSSAVQGSTTNTDWPTPPMPILAWPTEDVLKDVVTSAQTVTMPAAEELLLKSNIGSPLINLTVDELLNSSLLAAPSVPPSIPSLDILPAATVPVFTVIEPEPQVVNDTVQPLAAGQPLTNVLVTSVQFMDKQQELAFFQALARAFTGPGSTGSAQQLSNLAPEVPVLTISDVQLASLRPTIISGLLSNILEQPSPAPATTTVPIVSVGILEQLLAARLWNETGVTAVETVATIPNVHPSSSISTENQIGLQYVPSLVPLTPNMPFQSILLSFVTESLIPPKTKSTTNPIVENEKENAFLLALARVFTVHGDPVSKQEGETVGATTIPITATNDGTIHMMSGVPIEELEKAGLISSPSHTCIISNIVKAGLPDSPTTSTTFEPVVHAWNLTGSISNEVTVDSKSTGLPTSPTFAIKSASVRRKNPKEQERAFLRALAQALTIPDAANSTSSDCLPPTTRSTVVPNLKIDRSSSGKFYPFPGMFSNVQNLEKSSLSVSNSPTVSSTQHTIIKFPTNVVLEGNEQEKAFFRALARAFTLRVTATRSTPPRPFKHRHMFQPFPGPVPTMYSFEKTKWTPSTVSLSTANEMTIDLTSGTSTKSVSKSTKLEPYDSVGNEVYPEKAFFQALARAFTQLSNESSPDSTLGELKNYFTKNTSVTESMIDIQEKELFKALAKAFSIPKTSNAVS